MKINYQANIIDINIRNKLKKYCESLIYFLDLRHIYQKNFFQKFLINGNKRNKIPSKIIGSSATLQFTAKKQYAKMLPARRQDRKSAGKSGEEFLQMPQLW